MTPASWMRLNDIPPPKSQESLISPQEELGSSSHHLPVSQQGSSRCHQALSWELLQIPSHLILPAIPQCQIGAPVLEMGEPGAAAQRIYVICPRSHSREMEEPGFSPLVQASLILRDCPGDFFGKSGKRPSRGPWVDSLLPCQHDTPFKDPLGGSIPKA